MKTTENSIDFELYNPQGSPGYRDHWTQGINQLTETYLVAAADYDTWTVDMLGVSSYDPGSASGTGLARQLPEYHWRYNWMIPVDIQTVGVISAGVTHDDLEYEFTDGEDEDATAKYIVQVTYKGVMFDLLTDEEVADLTDEPKELGRFVDRQEKANIEALTLKGVFLAFSGTNTVIDTNPVVLFHMKDIYYAWHNVPSDPDTGYLPDVMQANIDACIGKVNNTTFDGYDAETLLCTAPDIRRLLNASGDPEYEVVYRLQFRPEGWNVKYNVLHPGNSAFIPAYYDVVVKDPAGSSSTTKPYTPTDFNVLFELV